MNMIAFRVIVWSAMLAVAPPATESTVPLPPLAGLESAVADHVREAHAAVEDALAGRASASALADAYGEYAQVLHAYEMVAAAEAAYGEAVRLRSTDARWHYLRGYLYQQVGRLDDAAADYRAAERLDPARRESTLRLAEVYLQTNQLRLARTMFEALIEVFPALARQGLGEVALR